MTSQGRTLRPVLWLLLVLSVAANAVASTVNLAVGAAFGVLALACAAALVRDHYRHRRS